MCGLTFVFNQACLVNVKDLLFCVALLDYLLEIFWVPGAGLYWISSCCISYCRHAVQVHPLLKILSSW